MKGQWGDPLLRMEEAERMLQLLTSARDAARAAGIPQTHARILLAITSAKGAVNHARGRFSNWARTQTQEADPL